MSMPAPDGLATRWRLTVTLVWLLTDVYGRSATW